MGYAASEQQNNLARFPSQKSLVKIGKRRATSDEHSDNKDDLRKEIKQKTSLNRTEKTEYDTSKDAKFVSGSLAGYLKPPIM